MELKPDSQFKAFLDAAPDAIVVVDKDGHIVMINELTEKMFGYRRDEISGQKVEVLVPERFHSAHLQDRAGYFADPRTRRMGEGQSLAGRRKDSSEFPVEISLSPLHTDQGTFAISIIRDVTSRKQLEAKFQGLLESAPDGIVVVDVDARIVIANTQAEKMFGYKRGELLGQLIEILVPSQFQKNHVDQRSGYIGNPRTRPMGAGRALTGQKKDGTEFPLEISLSPLQTAQGTLVTSIIRDITDRRRAEQQLQASLLEKEALLKEIHHRVKNNLQVTSSLIRLQADYIQDPKAKELFAESHNRIRSMALVHEKLYQARELSRIDFSEYSKDLARLLFGSLGVNPERISLKISGDPLLLSIEDAIPCGLILNELLSNSIKHAFPNSRSGVVTLHVDELRKGGFEFVISDDGVGFEPGFSWEEADTLGLQLVRTLVNQVGGQLTIESASGTRISIVCDRHSGAGRAE